MPVCSRKEPRMTTNGIIGTPLNVCATFIVLFIILGSFLEQTGIGNFFIDLANSIAGFASGGPAKVAVISSALEGMYSGSSVANTVGSGSVTIQMCIRDSYKTFADSGSMYNTPPCFAIYVAGLVYEWVEQVGGVKELERRNREKSSLVYNTLDASSMFKGAANPADRSIMNATFTLPDEELTKAFLALCEKRGMINLKGHRVVGGCRASMYNAMPLEGAQLLCETICDFEKGVRA